MPCVTLYGPILRQLGLRGGCYYGFSVTKGAGISTERVLKCLNYGIPWKFVESVCKGIYYYSRTLRDGLGWGDIYCDFRIF